MGSSDRLAIMVYKVTVTEYQSVMDKPRNVRQVQYIREKTMTDERPTKDAISNLQAMVFEDEGFIHYIATYPDLVCIAGLGEILMHLNSILEVVPKVEQLLSYDAMCSMGDFAFQSWYFRRKSCGPCFSDPREESFQSHHQHLFESLRRYCKGNLKKNIALATVMEIGIA